MSIKFKDQVHEIMEFQHVKPGKGGAFVRSRLKNLETGKTYDHTFRAAEKVEQVLLDTRKMQYLYREGDNIILMDLDTYEQTPSPASLMGSEGAFLNEGMEVTVVSGDDKTLSITVPFTVELKVTQADPGVMGNTAQGGTKPVTLETGAVIQVPLFIQQGDMIKVDTRKGEYLERCN